MFRPFGVICTALLCNLIANVPMPARAYTGQDPALKAKVTLMQARAIALTAAPGVITDQELEREAGGRGLRYSFDVKRGATTFGVGVDAQTDAVLEDAPEGPNSD